MSRQIQGALQWARAIDRPLVIPMGRPRGAKRLGILYERKVAELLPQARWGQWFEYADESGRHFCQPDAILPYEGGIVCVEVKLGWTSSAEDQLNGLYLPVLRVASQRRVWGVTVCQHLRGTNRLICDSLGAAIALAQRGENVVWHLDPRVALRTQLDLGGVGKSISA